MRKRLLTVALAGLAVGVLPALSSAALAQEADAARPAHYSVATTLVGTLLDDPAAVEILKRLIPTVYANDQFQQAGRSLTLKAIQQYEPDALSDENLAKIQAEFDKIPAKS
jgi:para-nitrobenzyl esterase